MYLEIFKSSKHFKFQGVLKCLFFLRSVETIIPKVLMCGIGSNTSFFQKAPTVGVVNMCTNIFRIENKESLHYFDQGGILIFIPHSTYIQNSEQRQIGDLK